MDFYESQITWYSSLDETFKEFGLNIISWQPLFEAQKCVIFGSAVIKAVTSSDFIVGDIDILTNEESFEEIKHKLESCGYRSTRVRKYFGKSTAGVVTPFVKNRAVIRDVTVMEYISIGKFYKKIDIIRMYGLDDCDKCIEKLQETIDLTFSLCYFNNIFIVPYPEQTISKTGSFRLQKKPTKKQLNRADKYISRGFIIYL
jgi:nitrogen regulatory protein PII